MFGTHQFKKLAIVTAVSISASILGIGKPINAQNSKWIFINYNSAASIKYYYDAQNVIRQGNLVILHLKNESSGLGNVSPAGLGTFWVRLNCATRTVTKSADGKNFSDERAIPRGTIVGRLYSDFCVSR